MNAAEHLLKSLYVMASTVEARDPYSGGHSETGIPLQPCPMCGPTIFVRRTHRHGDHLYCRSGGGEVELNRRGASLAVRPTGRRGTPADLEPDIDYALIDEPVKESEALIRGTVATATLNP